jgi:hypothetical protein
MTKNNKLQSLNNIEDVIITVRDTPVILDSDVANLYGVETKRINEAVKRNGDKFPSGYVLNLEKYEWDLLKSHSATSMIDTPSKGGKTKLPQAFTEKGLYMLATILKSPQATQTTIEIIETFSKIKELSKNVKSLQYENDKQKQKNITQRSGEIIADILDDGLDTDESETTIELNLAVLKFKHTIKKK